MKKIEQENPFPKLGEIKNIKVENNITSTEKLQKLIDENNKHNKELSDEDKEELFNLLLECVWVSRWTDEKKESLYAVLTPEEAENIVNNILKELDDNNFKIVKNNN